MSDKYAETDSVKASKKMMDAAGVTYRIYEPSAKKVELDL